MFALSWPMVLASLGQVAMTATDVAMLGRLGADALAASALGSTFFFVLFIFGTGLLSALSPMLANERGRNRFAVREVRRTVRQGIWSAVILAVPFGLVLWHSDRLLALLGQDPRLIPEAVSYARAVLFSLLPAFLFVVFRNFTAALHRPRWALGVTLGAVALNVLVNWVLIFGNLGAPALGVVGAGIATSIVSSAMVLAAIAILSLDRRFRRYHLIGRLWRSDWPRLKSLWRLGLPIAATLIFEVGIFSGAVLLMGLISPVALAAHQIAIQIASVAFMVPMGIGQAVTVRIAGAAGARDPDGVARAAQVAMLLGVGFMCFTAVGMVVAPMLVIGLFIDAAAPANAEVVALAVKLLVLAAIFQVVDGAQAIAIGMLRGLQDTKAPMLVALFGYWGIGFPLGVLLAFPLGLGAVGVWIGLAASLAVVAVLLLYRWGRPGGPLARLRAEA